MALVERVAKVPEELEGQVFGQFDAWLKRIERTLNVTVIARDSELRVIGSEPAADGAKRVLEDLAALAEQGSVITEQNVNYALSLAMEKTDGSIAQIDREIICHFGQKNYVEAIRNHMITFGIGPAGTGKTYLAMAAAITAFKNEEVSRIIMTRPAIEAGEKLGFLPGDLQSKIDPYLRPLYDALYQIMGPDSYQKNAEKGLIEVAPLAYMRGRTLDNAFIILDEAQNTTPAQMKMFLTRVGFGSKVIVTGDLTQKDLPFESRSGLEVAVEVLSKIDEIAFCHLTSKDVVRHPLVQKIVQAYETYEKKHPVKEDGRPHSGRRDLREHSRRVPGRDRGRT